MTPLRVCGMALLHTGLLTGVMASVATAQPAAPHAKATRVAQAPRIDGRLGDPAWTAIPPIDDFRQREPAEGAPTTEITRVRIAYDDTTLYFGIECRDDPSQIRAVDLRRDNLLDTDDTFAVLLDTQHDHRNAFVFRVNPRGTRYDGLIRNEGGINADWDEDWTAAAALTETGWTAEIAIPFKILRFRTADAQEWGLNFERTIKRKNEVVYWAGWSRNFAFTHVSQAGHLALADRIARGERFRLRPYALAGTQRLQAPGDGRNRARGDIGIDDLKISVTNQLTADLTVNPDFAQTDADTQQVNLTRYSLFFPEKRQFFIENADSLQLRPLGNPFGSTRLEVFYSRRIGLSDGGEPVRILGGGKLTGKAGPVEVGLLNAQTASTADTPSTNFLVGRVRLPLFGRSYVGGIITNRQGATWNRVAGADARMVVHKYLVMSGMFARSFDSRSNRSGWARQLGADYNADLVSAAVNYIQIDPAFQPDVGYVRRHDRLLGARVVFGPRPTRGPIQIVEFLQSTAIYHDTAGSLVGRQSVSQISLKFRKGDSSGVYWGNDLERLPSPLVLGGQPIPAGLYNWNSFGYGIRSYRARWISVNLDLVAGSFYNGTKWTYGTSLDIRPNENLSFNPSYQLNDISLPGGRFTTHLFGLRSNISLSKQLLTSAYVQYNSAGALAAVQLRLNYNFRRIDNLFVVYNDVRYTGGLFANQSNRSLVVKFTYSVAR